MCSNTHELVGSLIRNRATHCHMYSVQGQKLDHDHRSQGHDREQRKNLRPGAQDSAEVIKKLSEPRARK